MDNNFVKKFFRSSSQVYIIQGVAMYVSLNADDISFDEVVGMLRAHVVELEGGNKGKCMEIVS